MTAEPTRLARTVVLISGTGTNLQALLDARQHHGLPVEICRVISNRADAGGLARAEAAGVATRVVGHGDYSTRQAYDTALAAEIDACRPDLVVLAGFMRILTDGFVQHYLGRMMNIHPSLLPAYRGLHTHRRVLEDGRKEHGCSVHFVTPDLDAGPVIVQSRITVSRDDTEQSLAQRVQQQEHRIYPLAVGWFAEGRLRMEQGQARLDDAFLRTPVIV